MSDKDRIIRAIPTNLEKVEGQQSGQQTVNNAKTAQNVYNEAKKSAETQNKK